VDPNVRRLDDEGDFQIDGVLAVSPLSKFAKPMSTQAAIG
jgi:hypothetical protein